MSKNDNAKIDIRNNGSLNNSDVKDKNTVPFYPLWGSCRMVYTICAFLTTTNMILMRFNLSFALVCMVRSKTNTTASNVSSMVNEDGCYLEDSGGGGGVDLYAMGEFDWGKELQGRLLSGFFYGYIVSQAFGGWFSDKFGGKLFFILGNFLQSICTILIPLAARLHPEMLFAIRVLQGIVCGLCLPALYVLYTKWAAPNERTKLMGVAYTGFPLANVIIFPLASMLCQTGIDGGWPMIFYVTGLFGVICSFAFCFLIYDNPDKHPRISDAEKRFLKRTTHTTSNAKLIVPWNKIIRSVPVHAYNVAHFCQTWGFVTLAVNLPTLMKEMLFFDLNSNGLLSAMPYICALAMRTGIAYFFRPIQEKTGLSITNLRKVNHLIGTIIPGICMLCVAALTCQEKFVAVGIIMLAAAMTDVGFTGSYLLSYLELAPQYAGLLTGLSNTVGALPGVITNTLVGYITTNGTRQEWQIVLYIMAANYFIGGLIYTIFGSSELQPWAKTTSISKDDPAAEVIDLDRDKNDES